MKWFSLVLFFFSNVKAAINLPKTLNSENRKQVIKDIGFSTVTHFSSGGYLLGGYSGFEIFSELNLVPLSKLNSLGLEDKKSTDQYVNKIGFGKGLFHDIDFFIGFSPFFFQNDFSIYFGSVKYTFYKNESLPIHIGIYLHFNAVNINNLYNFNNTGYDFYTQYYQNRWSYFFGFGQVRSIGTFVGGASGVTIEGDTAREDLTQNRTFLGLSYKLENVLISGGVEKFYDNNFTLRIGYHF